jgi:hypothetical protein
VVADDGKKIKNAAKRLAPTRGFAGKLIGAKALVAMDLRSGLVLAMSDSLDGEANDVPLVPALLPQAYEAVGAATPALFVLDRQFGDARRMRRLAARPGDRFVVRLRKGLTFRPAGAAEPPARAFDGAKADAHRLDGLPRRCTPRRTSAAPAPAPACGPIGGRGAASPATPAARGR